MGVDKGSQFEQSPLLGSAKPTNDQPQQPERRKWSGHLLNVFGDCSARDFGVCLITHYVPCATFGLTMRRAFSVSALRQALLFASLMFITYAHYAAQVSLMTNECLIDNEPLPDMHNGMARRFGGHFSEHAGEMHGHPPCGLKHLKAHAAKPFGRRVNADNVDNELCGRLVTTAALLNLATLFAGVFLIVYGARLRSHMRERYNIEGSHCGDFMAWWCCMPCAMCQEHRTLAKNNVVDGVWYGAEAGLPVETAAAYTTAPAVPIMSALEAQAAAEKL